MQPTSEQLPAWALDAIPLLPNRVHRSYRGGAQLDAFRGRPHPEDGDEPEDWVGSITHAWMPTTAGETEVGLSQLADGRQLRDLLEEAPEALVGTPLATVAGATTALLVKLLDSAIRLPVHCHPTRPFARRVLGSPFGKTEAWVILATRQLPGEEPPNVRLGFTHEVSTTELRRWIEERRSDDLLAAMHRRPAVPGDVWLVPAGLPHAIGAGIFLVELQEPSDFSVVAETGGFPDTADDASLGRGWDVMLDCFDRRGYSEEAIDALRSVPPSHPGRASGDTTPRLTRLLGQEADPYFRALRLTMPPASRAAWPVGDSFAVVVVTGGAGELGTPGGGLPLRAGETFALPAAASGGTSLISYGGLELVVCLPPDPEAFARDR